MSNDPSQRADSSEVEAVSVPPEEIQAEQPDTAADDSPETTPGESRILIGSQRDPDAYRPKPRRDWEPLKEKKRKDPDPPSQSPPEASPAAEPPAARAPTAQAPTATDIQPAEQEEQSKQPEPAAPEQPVPVEAAPVEAALPELEPIEPLPPGSFPPPSIRDKLPPELEEELEEAMGDTSLDELMADSETVSAQLQFEPESRHTGRVLVVQREDVFVELGGREQGIVPLKQFEEPPEPESTLDVVVVRFNAEDGLYELMLPHASANVADWSDLSEGLTVDVRITGHNTGGLECEVNHIRGFIPVSQISLYRVEDMTEYVDQKLTCLVTEVNPQRNNLVLSRRAMLEREREQARLELLESLKPGQIHEGVVRKLMDFGAFVDLGGVDGLLHISQLGWGRVNHPSDVLTEGQTIKVKIEKVDHEKNRISLGYRDMLENPWTDVESKYPVHSTIRGTVSKLMEFGAFVQLEPGVEGLVHISELSHKRVVRSSDVVSEGEEIEAVVLSVDSDAQRISLSMKDTSPLPTKPKDEDEPAPEPAHQVKEHTKPLKGGLKRATGGEQFGLKW